MQVLGLAQGVPLFFQVLLQTLRSKPSLPPRLHRQTVPRSPPFSTLFVSVQRTAFFRFLCRETSETALRTLPFESAELSILPRGEILLLEIGSVSSRGPVQFLSPPFTGDGLSPGPYPLS